MNGNDMPPNGKAMVSASHKSQVVRIDLVLHGNPRHWFFNHLDQHSNTGLSTQWSELANEIKPKKDSKAQGKKRWGAETGKETPDKDVDP